MKIFKVECKRKIKTKVYNIKAESSDEALNIVSKKCRNAKVKDKKYTLRIL